MVSLTQNVKIKDLLFDVLLQFGLGFEMQFSVNICSKDPMVTWN